MRSIRSFISIAAVVAAVAASAFAQGARDIGTGRWDLIAADGRTLTAATDAYLQMTGPAGRFEGNTGCNQMWGNAAVRGRRITFSGIATTRRACRMMAGSVAEDTFLAAMRRTVRYAVSRGELTFYDRRGREALRFRSSQAADTGIAGKWTLETLGGRRHTAKGEEVFVRFDPAKGSAGGNTGCNVFGGSYTASGRNISITDVISTMRACEEDNRMQVERDFLNGLRSAQTYEIRNGKLHLLAGSRVVMVLARSSG